jgi:hypothetical protein
MRERGTAGCQRFFRATSQQVFEIFSCPIVNRISLEKLFPYFQLQSVNSEFPPKA